MVQLIIKISQNILFQLVLYVKATNQFLIYFEAKKKPLKHFKIQQIKTYQLTKCRSQYNPYRTPHYKTKSAALWKRHSLNVCAYVFIHFVRYV